MPRNKSPRRSGNLAQEESVTYMLCRNRVQDFDKWKAVFDSHPEAQKASGLRLLEMWRSVEDPNNVFFIFEAKSVEAAQEFINHPDSAKAGEVSGVIDGEIHFVESVPGY